MISFISYASSSHGNLYSVSDEATTVMIDCGLPWRKVQKTFDFKTSKIAAVCLGHEHQDHSKGIKNAAAFGLDVYLLPETKKNLMLSGHRYHEIELLKQFDIGSISVMAFPLQHDAPNCGFLIADRSGDKLVYINDSYYSKYRFKGIGIFAVECNYSPETMSPDISPAQKKRLLTSHFSLENVKRFFLSQDLSRCRCVHLLHLSRDNSDAALFQREIAKITGLPVFVAEE